MKDITGKVYKNNKTGNNYVVLGDVINATNSQDGQRMILYTLFNKYDNNIYARETNEFFEKFTLQTFFED